MMKLTKNVWCIATAALLLVSCGSKRVTLEDVREQEQKALEQVEKAKEESVTLAEMKQKFSEDYKKARMEALREQIREIDKDVERLGGVTTSEAQTGTKGLVSDLKERRNKLEQEMNQVEKLEKENWEQTMQAIDQQVASIKQLINKITANLEERKPVDD